MTNKHDERERKASQQIEQTLTHKLQTLTSSTKGQSIEYRKGLRDMRHLVMEHTANIAYDTLTTHTKEVREQTLAEVREVIANKKTREMQSGENLGKYKAFQRGEEHMRCKLLDTLENK